MLRRDTRVAGFTLIELLVVVAIIGIIAAIAVPSLLRARASANEANAIGDTRTVISSEAAYHASSGGWYGTLPCLNAPWDPGCIPNYPVTAPTFIDTSLALVPTTREGYIRSFSTGPVFPLGVTCYLYESLPAVPGQTGVRGFDGDCSGKICFKNDGTGWAPGVPPGQLPGSCEVLQ